MDVNSCEREKQNIIVNLKKNRFRFIEELESLWAWKKTKGRGIELSLKGRMSRISTEIKKGGQSLRRCWFKYI